MLASVLASKNGGKICCRQPLYDLPEQSVYRTLNPLLPLLWSIYEMCAGPTCDTDTVGGGALSLLFTAHSKSEKIERGVYNSSD
jgi:hypothetical protein